MSDDYRMGYVQQAADDEAFKLEIKADRFIFHGDKGTNLEMRPLLPRKMIIEQDGKIITVTKNSIKVQNPTPKRAKQLNIFNPPKPPTGEENGPGEAGQTI
jgi:hypothetical protein